MNEVEATEYKRCAFCTRWSSKVLFANDVMVALCQHHYSELIVKQFEVNHNREFMTK